MYKLKKDVLVKYLIQEKADIENIDAFADEVIKSDADGKIMPESTITAQEFLEKNIKNSEAESDAIHQILALFLVNTVTGQKK